MDGSFWNPGRGPVQWAGVSSRLRFFPFAEGEWLPHVMSARCDLT
jgi:hypothetical protein